MAAPPRPRRHRSLNLSFCSRPNCVPHPLVSRGWCAFDAGCSAPAARRTRGSNLLARGCGCGVRSGKKTSGGAGAHTGHTRDTRAHTGIWIIQTNLLHGIFSRDLCDSHSLQIYTVHELDFRCRQTEEHASVQIINSFYKLCSPFQSSRQISLSVSSHCLRIKYTAGHALTSGHKQALRHASESPLSSERVQYSKQYSTGTGELSQCASSALRAHTHTHTHT